MRTLRLMILCVVAFALVVCLMGPAQAQEEGTVTKLYRMKGKLEAIDLTQRWVMIGGLQWDLADDFATDDFSTPKWGRIEYARAKRVIFFVRCREPALQGLHVGESTTVERVTRLDVIKELNEKGCKVYTMERAQM